MEGPLRLVYIIGTYPLLTMTYVDREIRILRQWGVDLQVLAVRRQDANIPLSADQRGAIQEGVIYLLPVSWLSFVISQFYFAIFYPQRYFKTLIYLLTRPHPRQGEARYLTPRFMTFLHFIEGVYAAYLLRDRQFEELHAHTADRASTIALVIGRLLDKPYSLSIHAGHDIFVNPILLSEKIMGARHVATCTAYNKTYLESVMGQDLSHKVSYIHHGLDLTKYQPQPSNNERPKILSVGRLSEKKGLVHLIRACRILKDQEYDFTCHIVGDGPQALELKDLVTHLSLEDTVIFHGALPHEEVIKNYRQATMFVLPCIKSSDGDMDGIPNVLPEAMAMQLPVVSTDISGVPELIDDQVNGLLTPSGDDDALATAMARLLDDPALREKLGQNGRQSIADTFDVNRNVRKFATTLWPDWFPNCEGN